MTKQPTPPPAPAAGPTIAYRIPGLPQRPPAFAPNPYLGPHWQEDAVPEAEADTAEPAPADLAADLAAELARSLQLSRAGALSLTRLQLAIKGGDRQATMAAMDRLHAVDAEMERLVDRLPHPGARDPARAEWDAISRHLTDQKLSLAFEKLAMVSEISGPGMTSPSARPDLAPPRRMPAGPSGAPGKSNIHPITTTAASPEPPLADWPRLPAVQPAEWTSLPAWLIGLLLAVLAMVAVGTAVVTLTG